MGDNFSSVTWKHFEQSQSCFKPIKNQEEKKTYPGNMEENSNYPEAIILSGERPTVDERWILLLGQWLHQGGSYYRRADTEADSNMLLYYCTDVNKSSLFQRWCTGGTCGGVRSAVCEATSPPPMSGWEEMTGMGWVDIDLKVKVGYLVPCNLTVKTREESVGEEADPSDRTGNYTALQGRWSRGRQVYQGGDFLLLASGWKWRIQRSTRENDKSAVEVGSAFPFCPAIASSPKSPLEVICQGCAHS